MKKLLAAALLLLSITDARAGSFAPAFPLLPIGTATNGLYPKQNAGNYSYGLPAPMKIICANAQYVTTASSSVGTDSALTSKQTCSSPDPISLLQLLPYNGSGNSPSELAGYNPIISRASLEYPVGVTVSPFSVNGQTTWTEDNNSPMTPSDLLGIYIPASTPFGIRSYVRVAVPPTSPSAAGITTVGGQCQTATTYFYKVTAVDNNIESGPTSEFSFTTIATEGINLSWTGNANASAYKIYRSTTTGAETLIATVAAPASGFQDLCAGQVASTTTPPAAQRFYFDHGVTTGILTNTMQSGGNGADLTGTASNAGFTVASPSAAYTALPYVVLGNDLASNSYCLMGDSIANGVGIIGAPANNIFPNLQSYWGVANNGVTRNTLNLSIPGAQLLDMLGNSGVSGQNKRRWSMLNFCDYVFDEGGRNDLYNLSPTWQTVASRNLALGAVLTARGKRYIDMTITPNTTSTDYFTTAGNQTALNSTNETARQNLNTWKRNGHQVDGSGNPVLTGGTSSPYIYGLFDQASYVEVNSSNALTLNGGFWQAPAAPAYTGQVLTGTPTLTSLTVGTANYAVNGLLTYVIKMTSGAANGQYAMILNNTATALTLGANGTGNFTGIGAYVGLTIIPAAGDTFSIYPISTIEGIHGTATSYAPIGTNLNTVITALPKF